MTDHANEDERNRYCTIVFEFDIRKTKINPFDIDTPFGKPVIISKGDQLSEDDDDDGNAGSGGE